MSRRIYSPSDIGAAVDGIAQIAEGGTEGTTPPEALAKLNVLATSELGAPNGVGMLDENGRLVGGSVPVTVVGGSTIQGSLIAITNSTNTYNITNYDFKKSYAVNTANGSVTINGSVITYNAPSTPVQGGFELDGRMFDINVIDPYVAQPNIITPVNGALNQPASVVLTGSEFNVVGGSDSHYSSSWEVATDLAFNNVVMSSFDDVVNKTSWTVSGLSESTVYYARVKYNGAAYSGSWSETSSFQTKNSFYAQAEQAILTPASSVAGDYSGWSVAVSDDGMYVALGAVYGNTNKGRVIVFVRNGSTWTQQQAITVTGASGDNFGYSVSLSADGTYLAIGARAMASQYGAAFVFLRTGTTWAQQVKIAGTVGEMLGDCVALSPDGVYLAISGPGTVATGNSCAYVYKRTGTAWAKEIGLHTITSNRNASYGYSIAISNDGTRVLVGAGGTQYTAGGGYFYLKTNNVWALEQYVDGAVSTAIGMLGNAAGAEIGLSGDGLTALFSTTGYSGGVGGSVVVFKQVNNVWTAITRLIPNDSIASNGFGNGVSITDDGKCVVVGTYYTSPRAAYLFSETNGVWSQKNKFMASDDAAGNYFGCDVDISASGLYLAVGAPGATSSKGVGYVFV